MISVETIHEEVNEFINEQMDTLVSDFQQFGKLELYPAMRNDADRYINETIDAVFANETEKRLSMPWDAENELEAHGILYSAFFSKLTSKLKRLSDKLEDDLWERTREAESLGEPEVETLPADEIKSTILG